MSNNQFKDMGGGKVKCTKPKCGKIIAYGAAPGHARRGCGASREPQEKSNE